MKKAFTMLELIFVIVVMGILAAVIMPNTRSNPVHEAAIQLANHIRYTQHLAMTDDRYDATRFDAAGSTIWFKDRWQLVLSANSGANSQESYTIFSDTAGNAVNRGEPQSSEVAVNPENINQIMTGGYTGASDLNISSANFAGMKKLNIGKSYGINSVIFSNSCNGANGAAQRISFDNLGRPFQGKQSSMNTPYNEIFPFVAANQRLITANCDIQLSDGTETVTIRIAPETGFTCVLDSLGVCL